MLVYGFVLKCSIAIKIVGYPIAAAKYKVHELADERGGKAMDCARKGLAAALNAAKKVRATVSKITPTCAF